MGKSAKGAVKKAERKQETERALKVQTLVREAQGLQDLLEQYGPFKRFEPLQASIQYFAAKTLQPEHLEWAFDLCKRNMEQLYATAWGWNDKIKRKELTHPEARFLLVFQQQQPVAFVHLRFEEEEREPVLYIYEMQLEHAVQRKRLGSFLMRVLYKIASNMGFSKVMLTVLDDNDAALHMYRGLGYDVDDTTPYMDPEEPHGYQIWSQDIPAEKRAVI